jgi:cytochrome c556
MRILAVISGLALLVGVAVSANEKAPAAFQQAMKDNGAALQKIAKDAEAKDYDAIAAGAAAMKATFMGPVGKYFTDTKMDAALAKCKEAYAAADNLEKAAKSKNEMSVAEARKAMGAACAGCHTAFRERLADGSFEIKK